MGKKMYLDEPIGYLPEDKPKHWWVQLLLAIQHVITMCPATVIVPLLTKFDVGTTLLTAGLGTIIAVLVSKRKIPLFYGSSFSYIAIIISVMSMVDPTFKDPNIHYCGLGVSVVQVGIICTGLVEIIMGILIGYLGKEKIDKVLPPVVTGTTALIIGASLFGAAVLPAFGIQIKDGVASINYQSTIIAAITIGTIIFCSEYLRKKGIFSRIPILIGLLVGYIVCIPLGLVNFELISQASWISVPKITLPAFTSPEAWGYALSIAFIAIATVPESTAHLYQISTYVDELAAVMKRKTDKISSLIGRNLKADGAQDLVAGFLGGCPGTNYGENNSMMAVTRCYSVSVIIAAGFIAMILAFVGKLSAFIYSIPSPVTGALSVYLFGVIAVQGLALMMKEGVNYFLGKNTVICALMLTTGVGGALCLPNGMYPIAIPYLFPNGIPAIVFAAILGIVLNLIFTIKPPRLLENEIEPTA